MTTKRRPRAAAEPSARGFTALLAAAAAFGVTCNAPERLFDEASSSATSGSSGGATSSVSASASASASGSGGASSATGAGGSGSSNSSTSEASSSSGSSIPCDGGPCDCDGDGEQSWECGGGDCADHDSRAHTSADFLLIDQPIQGPKKPGTQDFDFNCNGIVEGQIPPLPECTGLLGNCAGNGYLVPVPACGGLAHMAHCGPKGLGCVVVNDNTVKIQGCR